MKRKRNTTTLNLGDEGEPLAKCRKCLAWYSPEYAKAAGGHECNKLILDLVSEAKVAEDGE